MAETNPWADQWSKAQQQFVSAWSDMAKQGTGQTPTGQADLWAESFDLWRKACSGSNQPDMQQALNKCIDVGKGYFTMAEQIGKSVADGSNPTEAAMQWFEQLKASMQQMSGQFSMGAQPNLDGLMGQWFAPAQSWQQMAATMMPNQPSAWQMPGMDSSAFGMGNGTGNGMDSMNKLLSSPGLGYLRESQEKQQKGIKLAFDYQQSNSKYNQAFLQVSIKSLEGFQQQMAAMDSSEAPQSMRELYDLWVNVSEEHYAEFAMSEEYQALYGDMVNRLMAVKKHSGETTDDFLRMMNLPARSEIDTMQERLQQVRRENFALKKEINEIKTMISEMNSKPAQKSAEKAASPKQAVVAQKAATVKKAAAAKKSAPTKPVSKAKDSNTTKAKKTKVKTGAGS